MAQPIPNKLKAARADISGPKFTTLLVDGSNILKLSMSACRQTSSNGKEVGGIFQFLLQLKIMLQKGNFRHVYVFWDGENSGELRYRLNSDYKGNRDKNYDESELSDYMKEFNAKVRSMQDYFCGKHKSEKPRRSDDTEKELFYEQRDVIIQCLEEMSIRQCMCDLTEADDFIGYYVTHKEPNERIVIMSNDRDLTQLLSDDVIVYVQSKKMFLTVKNHRKETGYCHENVLLKKMLCGDASDNIKGVKGLGEKTLLANFPEICERKVTLDEVIRKASAINETRQAEKKKPLKWASNIVDGVTDGAQGGRLYEINEKIIDLRRPLMTTESIELLESIMHEPLDLEGRSYSNLYKIICESGVDELCDEQKFSTFFGEFKNVTFNEEKYAKSFGKNEN